MTGRPTIVVPRTRLEAWLGLCETLGALKVLATEEGNVGVIAKRYADMVQTAIDVFKDAAR